MGGLMNLYSKLFSGYFKLLSKLSLIILPIYMRLPRFLRVAILIMIIPFCVSLSVATFYYGCLVSRELRG